MVVGGAGGSTWAGLKSSVGAVGDDIDEDRMASLVEEHSILANLCAPLACAVAVACPGAEARWSP